MRLPYLRPESTPKCRAKKVFFTDSIEVRLNIGLGTSLAGWHRFYVMVFVYVSRVSICLAKWYVDEDSRV